MLKSGCTCLGVSDDVGESPCFCSDFSPFYQKGSCGRIHNDILCYKYLGFWRVESRQSKESLACERSQNIKYVMKERKKLDLFSRQNMCQKLYFLYKLNSLVGQQWFLAHNIALRALHLLRQTTAETCALSLNITWPASSRSWWIWASFVCQTIGI